LVCESAEVPHGLKPLIDRVHALGMDFGLWVEPEMVNPDSDLYRKHPEWVLNFPGRPRSEVRNQLVLNLAATMCAITCSAFSTSSSARRHRLFGRGLQPQLERARVGSVAAGRAEKSVRAIYAQFVRSPGELRHRHPPWRSNPVRAAAVSIWAFSAIQTRFGLQIIRTL